MLEKENIPQTHSVAEVLKIIRKEVFGLSILEFGELIGFSSSTYQRFERDDFGKKLGESKYSKLRDIAKGISNALFNETEASREARTISINKYKTQVDFNSHLQRQLSSLYKNSIFFDPSKENKLQGYKIANKEEFEDYLYYAFLCFTDADIDSEFLDCRLNEHILKSGLFGVWNKRAEIPTQHLIEKMKQAKKSIEILGYIVFFLIDHPDFGEILTNKKNTSCNIRILLGDPKSRNVCERSKEEKDEGSIASRIETVLSRLRRPKEMNNDIEIRLHDTPLYCSIYRFDDEMYVVTHLYGTMGSAAPTLGFKKVDGGLFNSYCKHFDDIWDIAKEAAFK